jgi:hypothetical protein
MRFHFMELGCEHSIASRPGRSAWMRFTRRAWLLKHSLVPTVIINGEARRQNAGNSLSDKQTMRQPAWRDNHSELIIASGLSRRITRQDHLDEELFFTNFLLYALSGIKITSRIILGSGGHPLMADHFRLLFVGQCCVSSIEGMLLALPMTRQ